MLREGSDYLFFDNIRISFAIAGPSSSPSRYEVEDLIELQYSVDGGAWTTASDTTYNGDGNTAGLHNGPLNVTTSATIVSADLVGVSTTSSFQVRAHFISGVQEEIAFDEITVTADSIPEPGSIALLGFGALGFTFRLSRR